MKRRLQARFLPRPSIRIWFPVLLLFLTFRVSAQTITTVAGSDLKGDGGLATGANLNNPQGVSVDGNGNFYIADQYNNRIRKVTPAGIISTVAGTGTQGFSGDGGAATSATLYNPTNVAVDGTGNLYIADYNNHRIRKVTVGGIISTVAGTGTAGFGGDGGPATSANLKFPTGITVDGTGNLFIADSQNQRVRKVTPAGVMSTIAGTGTPGYSGDGSDATLANLQFPYGVLADGNGNLFIADQNNHRIRKVTSGLITTVAGNGTQGAGGDGGQATSANLYYPFGMAVDGTGNLFIADLYNHRVRKVTSAGIISTVAGNGTAGFGGDGGPATSANLNYPAGVAVDASGNLLIADLTNKRIRKVTPGGVISTVAGNGTANFGGDGGQAASASLYNLQGVAVDGSGNLFIADRDNHRIRKVTTAGVISTVAGNGVGGFSGDGGPATTANLQYPTAVVIDGSGNLFIADRYNNRIRKVTPAGIIATVAGNGTAGFSGDGGAATSAMLYFPTGIAVDGSGTLFIADQANSRIRKVTSGGIISTVAGTGTSGFSGDGGQATSALLNNPTGVGVDGAGNLFIADQVNNRVRKVTSGGVISTVAGNGTPNSSGDGGPATNASLQYPASVFLDGTGNLFIADQYNNRIRKVTTGGTIFTVAGNGTAGFSGDGGAATSAMLNNPTGVVVDGTDNLFIADQNNQRIRKVSGPVRVSVSPAHPAAICSGSGFSLTATAVNITPTSYTWSSQPAGLSASGATPTFTAPAVNTPTTYTLTVTATDGTLSPMASVTLLVNALPIATLSVSGTLTCAQTSVMLTAGGGTSYAFNGPGIISQNPTSGTALVNASGAYSVTVTAATGCSAVASTSVSGTTQAPASPTLVASATSTVNQPISVTATGCAGAINWSVLGGSGSASGSIYTLAQPGNYTLSASCSFNGCTSSPTSLSLTIQANPPLALTAPDYNCQTGAITFRTTGGDGSLIDYFAIGITDWTSEPHQTISQSLLSDPKKVQLQARQHGVVVSYLFDLPAFCAGLPTPPQSSTNPAPVLNQSIASQTAVQGQAYSFNIPVGTFTDPQGEHLTYYTLGLPSGLSLSDSTINGTPNSVTQTTVTIIAVDPSGQTANTSFTLNVNPVVGQSCVSVMSGSWSSAATWSCGRVPLVTDEVTISAGHTVNLVSDSVAKKVTLIGVLAQANGVRLRINVP